MIRYIWIITSIFLIFSCSFYDQEKNGGTNDIAGNAKESLNEALMDPENKSKTITPLGGPKDPKNKPLIIGMPKDHPIGSQGALHKAGTGNNDDTIIDSDNDGVADDKDSCPNIKNPKQEDRDKDDQGDACDCDPNNPDLGKLSGRLFYVSPDGEDVSSCQSFNNPCKTIAYTISLASNNDTIILLMGTYNESNIIIDYDLNIFGFDPETIIVDGGEKGTVFNIAKDVSANFCGFSIIEGKTPSPATRHILGIQDGGGINNKGDLIVSNCIVRNNFAQNNGGGVFNDIAARLEIINSTIHSNEAQNEGGGIYNQSENDPGLIITASMIGDINNASLANEAINGGGIATVDGSTMIKEESMIAHNTANGDGGGIYNIGDSETTIIKSGIDYNQAIDSKDSTDDGRGGGIFNGDTARVILTDNSSMRANEAIDDETLSGDDAEGGAIYNESTASGEGTEAIRITQSQIGDTKNSLGNRADNHGGGISTHKGEVAIKTRSKIASNSARINGGGIYNADTSSLEIEESSLTSNRADEDGGAIYSNDGLIDLNGAIIGDEEDTSLGNTAKNGAGIAIMDGRVKVLPLLDDNAPPNSLRPSIIANNIASKNGGGFYHRGGNLQILESSIERNSAQDNKGGGIYTEVDNELLIDTSALIGNSAGQNQLTAGFGGGIYNNADHETSSSDKNPTIVRSTLSGNQAHVVDTDGSGGGIYHALDNSNVHKLYIGLTTIARNRPDGIDNKELIADVRINHTLIADNTNDCSSQEVTKAIGVSLDSDDTCLNDGNNFDVSELGPLRDNGGLTKTHALLGTIQTNRAIEGGDSTCGGINAETIIDPMAPKTDQRGNPIPASYDPDNDGEECDIGAFEKQSASDGE